MFYMYMYHQCFFLIYNPEILCAVHHIHSYTLFKHGKNISYRVKIKTDLHVCRVGVQGGHKAFDLIIKLFIRSDGSDIVWKVIPQLCPTEAETAF